jgi:hypothetical protein
VSRVLFPDRLQPKLDIPRSDGGGTYWSALQALIAKHAGCTADWVIRLDTACIRRERQYDKYEPAVTYYLITALALATDDLRDAGRLTSLFSLGFEDREVADHVARSVADLGWGRLGFEALICPTEAQRRAVRENVDLNPVPYLRQIAGQRPGVRFESPTHLDAFVGEEPPLLVGGGGFGLGIEAKFTSDIDPETTYSPHRNQIIRNVEVGNGRFRDFHFLLVTPRVYRDRRSRLYRYKMDDYRGPNGVEYLRADALCPPTPAEAAGWRRRIGWLTWEDIVAVVFPGGEPAFQHPDADALRDFLRDRRLFN